MVTQTNQTKGCRIYTSHLVHIQTKVEFHPKPSKLACFAEIDAWQSDHLPITSFIPDFKSTSRRWCAICIWHDFRRYASVNFIFPASRLHQRHKNSLLCALICAGVRLPHTNISTFHTIFNISCNIIKNIVVSCMQWLLCSWINKVVSCCNLVLTHGGLHGWRGKLIAHINVEVSHSCTLELSVMSLTNEIMDLILLWEKLSSKCSLANHALEPLSKDGWHFWDLLFPSLKLRILNSKIVYAHRTCHPEFQIDLCKITLANPS